MLKWIGGGCLVLILCVVIVMYVSYKKMSSIAAEGPAVTVSMAATPERIFTSLSDADSLSTWTLAGMSLRTSRKGQLVAGDTIFVTNRRDSVARSAWIIDTVVANVVVARRWVVLQNGMAIHRRRDSVAAAGDSTRVTSTVIAAMSDSANAYRGRGGVTDGLLDVATTMGTAGAKIQAEQELRMLKARIERAPAPAEGLKAKTVVRPDSG